MELLKKLLDVSGPSGTVHFQDIQHAIKLLELLLKDPPKKCVT